MRFFISLFGRLCGSMAWIVATHFAAIFYAVVQVQNSAWPLGGPWTSFAWLLISFIAGLVIWTVWSRQPDVPRGRSLVDRDTGASEARRFLAAIPAGLLALFCWLWFVVMSDHGQIRDHPARDFYGTRAPERQSP